MSAAIAAAQALDAALAIEGVAFEAMASVLTALAAPDLGELLTAYETARAAFVGAACAACEILEGAQ